MAGTYGAFAFAEVLEPALNDSLRGASLRNAVTEAAFALACKGAIINGKDGKLAKGASDERVVIGALKMHARELAQSGHLDDAIEVGEIMNRIDALPTLKPKREI